MEYVSTNNAPGAIGPYSQAVKTGNLLFTSGQIAINPATGNVEATTIEAQTRQVCENLKAVAEAAGTSLDKAVKTVCFLADIADLPSSMRCMALTLPPSLPAPAWPLRTCPRVCCAR